MKDIRKATIDSVLRDYLYSIDASKLSDDNIDISDNIVDESSQKYIQLLASFLNEAYYKGYIMSESILNKLLNVINYEGYEYPIMNAYANILLKSMKDNDYDEKNRPKYKVQMLSYSESKDYVMDYVNTFKNDEEINSVTFPHYKKPGSDNPDSDFLLMFLNEEQYPINKIYNDFENVTNPIQIAEYAYILYTYNKQAYVSLLNKIDNINPYIFFLLDNTDDMSLDIITDHIKTISALAKIIDIYEYFDINKPENKYSTLTDNTNKNINRLFELLSINVSDEQIAMLVKLDKDIWNNYYEANKNCKIAPLSKLNIALNLIKNDTSGKYDIMNPIEYIYSIKTTHYDDAYFYARYCLLNMDYTLFFNNFMDIYNHLIEIIDNNILTNLCIECIDYFKELKVEEIDNKINDLYVTLCYQTSNDHVLPGLIDIRNSIKK